MSAIKPLPDYRLDPPEDPPECPECDGPLIVIASDRMDCPACGWSIEFYEGSATTLGSIQWGIRRTG